jgi:hypothetical protein
MNPTPDFTTQVFDFLVKIATLSAPVILAYIAYLSIRAKEAADKVKTTLELANASTDSKFNVIHDFLNHERRVLLQDKATMAREMYKLTGRPGHLQTAEAAEKALADHDAGQKVIDDKASQLQPLH